MNEVIVRHITLVWVLMILGVISGAGLGLFFHRQGFLGGYGSWERRLVRLGHIAWFGMAFVNIAAAQTFFLLGVGADPLAMQQRAISAGIVCGSALMPCCCYIAALNRRLRYLFAVPVILLFGSFAAMALRMCHHGACG